MNTISPSVWVALAILAVCLLSLFVVILKRKRTHSGMLDLAMLESHLQSVSARLVSSTVYPDSDEYRVLQRTRRRLEREVAHARDVRVHTLHIELKRIDDDIRQKHGDEQALASSRLRLSQELDLIRGRSAA